MIYEGLYSSSSSRSRGRSRSSGIRVVVVVVVVVGSLYTVVGRQLSIVALGPPRVCVCACVSLSVGLSFCLFVGDSELHLPQDLSREILVQPHSFALLTALRTLVVDIWWYGGPHWKNRHKTFYQSFLQFASCFAAGNSQSHHMGPFVLCLCICPSRHRHLWGLS